MAESDPERTETSQGEHTAEDQGDEDEEDPFSMFGEDDDDEDEDENDDGPKKSTSTAIATTSQHERDPANGFNLYHSGTEHAMLHYVRNSLGSKQQQQQQPSNEEGNSTTTGLDRVLQLVDDFCYQRHWMMHIGPEKGQLLDNFLAERVQHHFQTTQEQQPRRPFVIVEVGTYCGYSTARMLRTLLEQEQKQQQQRDLVSFFIITVDVDPMHTSVAQQLHQLALEGNPYLDQIAYITLDLTTIQPEEELAGRVQQALSRRFANDNANSAASIDFLFLDHDKDLYHSDLQALEQSGMIRAQTAVAADNVVFFQLNDYVQYMKRLQEEGIVQTETVVGQVEYIGEYEKQQAEKQQDEEGKNSTTTPVSPFWQDGLELSVYLKEPKQLG